MILEQFPEPPLPVEDVKSSCRPVNDNQGSQLVLEIRRGRATNCSRVISDPVFLVGNNTDCDMVLGDRQFPPIHFYVIREGSRNFLRKIGSSPDVSINGEPIVSSAIQDGDRIRTGPFEFIVRAA